MADNLETLVEAEVEAKGSLCLQNSMKKETDDYKQTQCNRDKDFKIFFAASPNAVKRKVQLSPLLQLQNDIAGLEPTNHLIILCDKLPWSRKMRRFLRELLLLTDCEIETEDLFVLEKR